MASVTVARPAALCCARLRCEARGGSTNRGQRDEPCMLLVSAPIGLDAARLRSPSSSSSLALATSSQSVLTPLSPRAQRPRQSIPDTKLPMQTGATRRWRDEAEMDYIRSLRLKPWSVTGLVPLCSNCGRSSNGFLLVGPRMTKRERLRSRKERRQRLRQH